MTLPEPITLQETAWFAEQMRWQRINGSDPDQNADAFNAGVPVYSISSDGSLSKNPGKPWKWLNWNPRTSIADAIELEKAFFLDSDIYRKGKIWNYRGWRQIPGAFEGAKRSGRWVESADICTAICEAVRARGGNDGSWEDLETGGLGSPANRQPLK